MNIGDIFNIVFRVPIVNLLMAFYKLFEFLHIPGPLGWAVIALTLSIRLILYPLMSAQMKSARKMAKIKPHMDALNAKHKGDKQALQQAQMALYKEHGINPAAGCIPLLVQLPVLIALYNVFYEVLNSGGNIAKVIAHINSIVYYPALHLTKLDLTFFGINLGIKPSEWQKYGIWLLAIPLVTALLQWYQSKLMMPPSPAPLPALVKKDDQKDEKKPEDTAAEMQKQMMMITPVMFGFFALQFPLGLALYWNVFGLFGIIQQLRINKNH
jgi:YidC/Oxa1 family membrane protein insertase